MIKDLLKLILTDVSLSRFKLTHACTDGGPLWLNAVFTDVQADRRLLLLTLIWPDANTDRRLYADRCLCWPMCILVITYTDLPMIRKCPTERCLRVASNSRRMVIPSQKHITTRALDTDFRFFTTSSKVSLAALLETWSLVAIQSPCSLASFLKTSIPLSP